MSEREIHHSESSGFVSGEAFKMTESPENVLRNILTTLAAIPGDFDPRPALEALSALVRQRDDALKLRGMRGNVWERLEKLEAELKAARLTIESQATVYANYVKSFVKLETENAALRGERKQQMHMHELTSLEAENITFRKRIAQLNRVVDAARALVPDSINAGKASWKPAYVALREALDSLDNDQGDKE